MTDEEGVRVEPRGHAGSDRYGETTLYDFAKATGLLGVGLGGFLVMWMDTLR